MRPAEKIHMLNELCSGTVHSAVAMSLLLISQQHILNEVSFNRNTLKTRFHWLMKML